MSWMGPNINLCETPCDRGSGRGTVFFILKLVSVGEGGVNSRILKAGVQLCFVEGIGISM